MLGGTRARALPDRRMFTHLHTHTEYSLLDGLARIPQLVERAQALGQQALAITDHGAMYGVIEFYKEARQRGLKPIVGVEAYVAPGSRHSRDPREKNAYHHLTLLARNREGYSNLIKLTSFANLEGYYYKPRVDRELLARYGKGIIALSGCPGGEVFKALYEGRERDAHAALGFYRDVFDAVYVEIQGHADAEGELRTMLDATNPRLVALARQTGLALVATHDAHYTAPEDAAIHEVLLCIGTNTTIDDPKRFRFQGRSFYLTSEEEMLALFRELPEAVHNTQRVVEACDLTLDFGRIHLPEPELPPGKTPDEHLADLCRAGLVERYGHPSPAHRERLAYELEVIRQTGFAGYVLIVAEIARAARERRIAMGVRGSAAASIVLYCLGVTDIDPVATRLVFERFLNVERREMPDVDMDFADDRREEMIRWAAERYGHDRVAQIITFGTMGAKAAIRDVGRALGMSYADTDRVARLVPSALHMTIDRALDENLDFRQAYDADPNVRRLVDTARRLEGVARHAGTHAAGVVISRDPLIEHVPLQKPARGDDSALPVTQFEMNTVAEIGLLKMDFLGLSNLTILGRAVDLIRRTRGIELDLKAIPDGDPKTYEMLAKGETFAVFQLESAGMRRYIQELKPSSIAELAAMVALYRPGPMQHIPTYCRAKHGLEPIRYPHPDLANILDETYGVIVFQDQVLHILRQFAGYTMGEADKVRKAMGKKIAEMMRAEREKFIEGARKQGYSEEDAVAIFDLIEPFAGYAFNRAHSACYGTIAYQTAYLKANYPAEYMTAVLMLADSHPAGFAERVGAAVAECVKLGIAVLPPDVNRSDISFSIENAAPGSGPWATGEDGSVPTAHGPLPAAPSAIRFGLATIKNVGEGAVEGIVAARTEGGAFTSLEDFCRRAQWKNFNKRTLESLIKAGALDGLGYNRTTLVANLDRIAALITREQRLRESGQATMFDLFGDEVPVPLPALELEIVAEQTGEKLAWERELLGVYVSEHPFRRVHPALAGRISAVVTEITAEMAGRELTIAGMVTAVRPLLTRAGRSFVAAIVEDLSGSLEVTCWPDTYERTRDHWQPGRILLLAVKVRARDERLDVTVTDAWAWDETTGGLTASTAPTRAEPPGRDREEGRFRAADDPDPFAADRQPPPAGDEDAPAPAGVTAAGPRNGHHPPARREAKPGTRAATRPEGTSGHREGPPGGEARVPRRLRIAVHETDDEAADRRRLNELVQVLRAIPGDDEVRLTIHTAHDEVELSLGTALVTDGIEQRLRSLLAGWGTLTVETATSRRAQARASTRAGEGPRAHTAMWGGP
jgi:DNA polymerase-3 subunit alpha